jgi:spectinomycin phosphotransferase
VLMNEHAASLATALGTFDELTAEFTASAGELVIPHGEPHSGNLIRADDGLLLIDWDLVGLAPPERDLWWIVSDSGAQAAQYAQLTGRTVSEAALSLYRLRVLAVVHRDRDACAEAADLCLWRASCGGFPVAWSRPR